MTTETKASGRHVVQSDNASFNCSNNQAAIRRAMELEGRFYGDDKSKGAKADRKRDRKREAHRQFMDEFPRQQFDRCLRNMMNGGSTPEEIAYFFDNLREYEQPIGSGNSEVIIVEFTTT